MVARVFVMNALLDQISRCQDDHDVPLVLADFLVEKRGFGRGELTIRDAIQTEFNGESVTSKIAIVIRLQGKPVLMIRYGPGSIVTRERSALAAARVYDMQWRVPIVVVTNSREAKVIDTTTGQVLGEGFASLPSRDDLRAMMAELVFEPYGDAEKIDREKRVLNVFDVNL